MDHDLIKYTKLRFRDHGRILPLGYISLRDSPWRHLPGAVDSAAWQPLKVKLATDLWVRPTCVRHIIAVEGHHVTEQVCA